MDAPEENKNLPFSNKQEEDDYWFHEYIVSLLSVEEAVPIDELLGKQEPGVGYVQDGYMKDSVDVGTKPELPSCTSSLHEKNAASYQKSLLPSCYTSDSQRCVLPRNDSYVIALPALNRSSATKTESSSSTSSWLLSASEGNCISQVPASTERYLGPPEIEVQATKDFTQSSVHVARSSARYPESPNSTSSLLLSASQRHCLPQVPASAERYFGPSEIEVQATKDFNRSSAHIARSSARHPESPSNTSFLLPASQGNHLSSLIPTPTERHLRPSEIQVHATNDFTQSPFHNARPSPRKLESPSSTSSFLLPASQGHRLSLIPALTERHLGPSEIEVQATKDFTQPSVHIAGEDFGQSISQRKRKMHNSDITEQGGSCRNCNCTSNCLKPYCECFAAGVYCAEPCTCKGCLNKSINEYIEIMQTRRNTESSVPHLLVPKVIRSPVTSPPIGDNPNKTPASKICHCKKIGCHMKSCSCSKGRVGCSISCKCEGCENMYGRKDNKELRRESNAFGSQTKFEKHFQTVPYDDDDSTYIP
ncbi:protein lin-54 homolog [Trifolium pratense]|uniref:protein lin-54 homolog n=1 Tax=Trifolium pratense TaxID=57577 RepID=UPI001E696140|nr:protein lin-54 homolog [Trifolium pratense]